MRIVLSLGTNIGNRKQNIKRAKCLIRKFCGEIVKETGIHETDPHGVKNQPLFLNQLIEINSIHPPSDLIGILKWIEKRTGRFKTYRWGPRVIDIDIIFADCVNINTFRLTIPHKGIKDRRYLKRLVKELDSMESEC